MIRMKLHIKIAEYRTTQKQVSEATGIRLPTLSAYCNDAFKTLPRRHLDALCKYFKCKVEDLVEYVEE